MAFPMSWIDRINAAIVRRIHGKATLIADDVGVELSGQRREYSGLHRAVAYGHPNPVGDALSVALDFGEGQIVVVSENDAAWRTVVEALDAHPRNRMPYVEWSVRLVADPTRQFDLLSPR
jgi:hypothetical protein